MIASPHPFPARMAPELAIAALEGLPSRSVVLDPMSGSGVVARQAIERDIMAFGYDLDPLAVLMSQVWTSFVAQEELEVAASNLVKEADSKSVAIENLPWVDEQTKEFIEFWFDKPQAAELAKLAFTLYEHQNRRLRSRSRRILSALKLSLSRIIVTKSGGASLASDTSHSRPHRTKTSSDFDVFSAFKLAACKIGKVTGDVPQDSSAIIRLGDARDLRRVPTCSVDAIITSPPYLNAIDYMRGHKLALVWLGYPLNSLGAIRSNSVGAERGPSAKLPTRKVDEVKSEMLSSMSLSGRHSAMIDRYIGDIDKMTARCHRVLAPGARATFVVGNSCLKNNYISNSNCVKILGERHGLRLVDEVERPLPPNKRYLPVQSKTDNPLQKRMRTETILTLEKPAD